MTSQTRALAEAAAKLPAAERILLVEEILATVASEEGDWAGTWHTEAARRVLAFERGEATATEADDVFSEPETRYR